MATIIKFKRRASGGAAGAPAALKTAEAAYNEVDNILYIGFGDDGSGNATSIIPLAGAGQFVAKTGAETIAGVKTFSSSPVVPTPSINDNSTKAATTAYVDSQGGFIKSTNRVTDLTAPNADFSMNSNKITNLSTPGAAGDAVNKSYVDALVQGLQWKSPVRAATTANITLSGAQTIDGVSVIAGDRVLVKDQSTGANNGIYVCASGAWTRATDFDVSSESLGGATVMVSEGTVNNNITYTLSTNDPITLGSTALVFTQITGGASGEANTASNLGTGANVFSAKVGVDLRFRSILGTSGDITVAQNTNDITLSLPSIDGGTF